MERVWYEMVDDLPKESIAVMLISLFPKRSVIIAYCPESNSSVPWFVERVMFVKSFTLQTSSQVLQERILTSLRSPVEAMSRISITGADVS